MAEAQLVRAGGVDLYIEVADGEVAGDKGRRYKGPVTVDADGGALSFDGLRESIEAVAGELGRAWEKVGPDEAVVEFGVKASAKSGKLTALIVEGGGEATLSVKLTWKRPPAQGDGAGG